MANWNTPVTLNDWMRNIEKRVMHQERRPAVRPAFDIVGPGIQTYSVEVEDWNSPGPVVDGFFYSTANQVVNSPNDTRNWMGIVQANAIGQGLQRVWEYIDTIDAPSPDPALYTRSFVTIEDGSREYTDWVLGGGGGGGAGGDHITVQEEDTTILTPVTIFDFRGAGVGVTTGDPGEVLITIPGGTDLVYEEFTFTVSSTWTINHSGFHARPDVVAMDSTRVFTYDPDITYPSDTQVVINWYNPTAGVARLMG